MTRKKEIHALRIEERGLFYLGLLKVDRLESELVTYSNLDYVVVMIPVVCNLSYTDVVTSIEYDVLVLVRETYRDREVYGLNVFCIILVVPAACCAKAPTEDSTIAAITNNFFIISNILN